jgi:hypothetical protein
MLPLTIMSKFLSYRLITAIILATALKVSAEPPPAEPIITATESTIAASCTDDRCAQPGK